MGESFVVLDGGTGTELSRLGQKGIDSNPLWASSILVSKPAVVKLAHKNFLKAGAEIIVSCSYQASLDGFKKHLGVTEDEALSLIRSSVHVAKQACEEVQQEHGELKNKLKVAGSVGPYGACLHDGSEYTGNYAEKLTTEELITWHRPRVKALLEGGTDMLAIETMPIQKEAEAVVQLLKDFPGSKAWVTFSCKDEIHTNHGESFAAAARSVIGSDNVIAVGINCTHPDYVTSLLQSLGQVNKPVIVKPNSGESWTPGKGWGGRPSRLSLENHMGEWINHGARWVGGCCRVYPKDIEHIKQYLATVKA